MSFGNRNRSYMSTGGRSSSNFGSGAAQRGVGVRAGGSSASACVSSASTSGGSSLAMVSVALQDHIMRNMSSEFNLSSFNHRLNSQPIEQKIRKPKATSVIDTGLKSKQTNKHKQTKQTKAEQEEQDHVIEEDEEKGMVAKPSLAQKLGILPGVLGIVSAEERKLNEQQWQSVKKQAGERGDYSSPCVICKETLGAQKQLITSCSHTFHQTCLEAFERFTGKKCCPMCRKDQYQKRIIHEASKAYKSQCATKIQATWKGFVVRKWYKKIRETHPPKDPKLREKYFMQKLEEITQRMLSMYSTDVDSFLRELDVDLRNSRKIMDNFNEQKMLENHQLNLSQDFWDDVCGKAFSRIDETSECPICMFQLVANKTLTVCSCTHVFHAQCLKTFEELSLNEQFSCPVCRSSYYSIDK